MANVIQNLRRIILSLSISGIVKPVTPVTNMNTNTQYVYYVRHKQASVNKWISKQLKKILLEILKIICEEVHVQ